MHIVYINLFAIMANHYLYIDYPQKGFYRVLSNIEL